MGQEKTAPSRDPVTRLPGHTSVDRWPISLVKLKSAANNGTAVQ